VGREKILDMVVAMQYILYVLTVSSLYLFVFGDDRVRGTHTYL